VVFKKLFETAYRKEILQSKLLMVQGKLQKEGKIIHVIVRHCFDFTKLLSGLTAAKNEALSLLTLSRADERTGIPFPSQK
jgi:error-prone DNA polymerase